jgi:eukaryotic translation initiation factor 2C
MAGPAKRRAQAEKKSTGSSDTQPSSNDRTQRSSPKAIAPLDGNMDPDAPRAVTQVAGRVPANYTNAKDLKNISDFLGMAGWYTARGVSPNCFPVPFH